MNKIKFLSLAALCLAMLAVSCKNDKKTESSGDYQSVANDPLKARIYTLDNGLKVYMTVNKEQPRIQTYIAVKTGSKNDPAETTGLAHYFEHLMFKGSTHFGTQNYEAEKPMLDEIEQLFETYRKTTDAKERKAIYHKIDSVSNEASKIAIPNEYDKLMAAIGASGTNAYTSYDVTCYTEDIPSNEIENWAKIQADRFKNSIIRGFHTELETVYEEYNMSLTDDNNKVFDSVLAGLFPHHPYGTQTVIGTQKQLKNPSITNIKNFFKTWYVPNNIAICLSGDFDPDEMIAVIKKYFGDMKPNENLPKLSFAPEEPITTPVVKEVLGREAESVSLAWRLSGAATADNDLSNLTSMILYNGQAGLIDLDLIQQQKLLGVYGGAQMLADYGAFFMMARPKQGQTLDQAKDLLLTEVAKLRAGDFDESLLKASIANYKLQLMQYMDSNDGRADAFVQSFINSTKWEDDVNQIANMEKITKADIVKFANEKLGENSYVVVYKRQGVDPNEKKIEKPEITPIATNRDASSDFLKEIQNSKVAEIAPVFVDFKKDMEQTTAKSNIPVLYKKNETTDIFELIYVFELGKNNDPTLNSAFSYLDYLGTSKKTPEQIKQAFYNIACSFSARANSNRCYVSVNGLSENMPQAMQLMEEILADAQPNEEVLANLKNDILKSRIDAKLNQSANFNALRKYVSYGAECVKNTTLTNEQVKALKSSDLIAKVKDLMTKQHSVLYYGPMSSKEVVDAVNKYHNTPETLAPVGDKVRYATLPTPESKVYMAQYDAKQIYYIQYSDRGEKFDVANDAGNALFNEYFGGGMNAIVFQEMREARGLAYSAQAWFSEPPYAGEDYMFLAFIATQNDKMSAAIDAFKEIIENMPQSEAAFKIAKEALLTRLRTERTIKSNVLWSYLNAKDMGVDYDRDKVIFEKVQNMTLDDVKAFHDKWIKGRTYVYAILGDAKDLDIKKLQSLGKIEKLTQQQIFGF